MSYPCGPNSKFSCSSWNYGSYCSFNPSYMAPPRPRAQSKVNIPNPNIYNRYGKRVLKHDERIVTNEYLKGINYMKQMKKEDLKRTKSAKGLRYTHRENNNNNINDGESNMQSSSNNKKYHFQLTYDDWIEVKNKQRMIFNQIKKLKQIEDEKNEKLNLKIDKKYKEIKDKKYKEWLDKKNKELRKKKQEKLEEEIHKEELKKETDALREEKMNEWFKQQAKKIVRSHSQTPLDPLNKNHIEDSPLKKPKEENIIKPSTKKVLKKIRDIYEFTHVGFDGEEPKENNQDNYFIYKNFADHKDYVYMSVCDGHGIEGHFVSDFIKDVLPYYMSENLKNTNILTEKQLCHQIITETFILVNSMLISNENINSLFSGSTCVSVIFTPEKLIVPNIGDSRAVLARFDKTTNSYKAIELSRDHKPTEKDEAKRIIENEGRIQPFTEEGEFVGPQRVWLKDEEVPGLAMTRSFGDRVAATVGVISEPEIKEFDFDENDKFMIIASDGIWEFISSQECVDIIKNFYEKNDMKGCAEYLYEESSKRWLKEEEVIDDTTLILSLLFYYLFSFVLFLCLIFLYLNQFVI